MKRAILASFLSTCIAGQAAALSCTPASVAASFQAASAAEEEYVLAVGRVQVLPGQTLPEPADPNNRPGYSVEAQFSGRLAAEDGFTQDAVFPVTVQVDCSGPWCGGVPIGRVLAFIERRESENVLVSSPCPVFMLTATPEFLAQAETCLAGGPCEPASQ
ncbi:hypothetical protein SAMN05444004_101202 [Jannaschia faecimaris]|uniref:Tissue inhibitor of metalloproteinase n=1 Tax=Jannaschia faecimaris TaxID=1244108 RepID=A0A1H3J4M2_9RHOB|nr:hypothetical protein [Jannaschia faecimaris]SDY34747.1 hypothetical protein SAMN05444004_101202 [Jannaschia faecimaris]